VVELAARAVKKEKLVRVSANCRGDGGEFLRKT
jgi:hypothetical protein